MLRINASHLGLAEEYLRNPLGPHSLELKRLLDVMRWDDARNRIISVQLEQDGPWYVAKTNGPKGTPLSVYDEQPFASLSDAQRRVFALRWQQHTGERLPFENAQDGDDTFAHATPSLQAWRRAQRPLLGYANEISVQNGARIEFKISSELSGDYHAEIVRLRSADHINIGLKQSTVDCDVNGKYQARHQPIAAGSFAKTRDAKAFACSSFTVYAIVWPTTPGRGEQCLLGTFNAQTNSGYALMLDAAGSLCMRLGDGTNRVDVCTNVPLTQRHWYDVACSVDATSGRVWLAQRAHVAYAREDTTAEREETLKHTPMSTNTLRIAAWHDATKPAPHAAGAHFNGKIEAPFFASRALNEAEKARIASGTFTLDGIRDELVAAWDFCQNMSSFELVDISGNGHNAETVNCPTRAMKSSRWDGSEYNWTHKPEHYAAVHFHDDDLHDCEWDTDFSFDVPADLASGLYCAYLIQNGHEDWIPFVVRPPLGEARAKLALLLPTASYWAYANRHTVIDFTGREHVRGAFTSADTTGVFLHAHPELGLSTYDEHSDGSGVCYSSRLRPILNMRPKEGLWQLPADTHIIDWLEARDIAFDVITEDDLHAEGAALLAPYRCVMTGTHPEYPSKPMLDGIAAFQQNGGRFIYLGGNGFYWRVSFHPSHPGIMEMRRAEDGIRAWLAEGGEYYHAFTGELGGMWRRMGHAPQSVAGTGMTAQGFDHSTFFERTPDSFDERARFIFSGLADDERIGDFGILGGGAAGWEIDRADQTLGTPPHALVVAQANGFGVNYHWMKEELTHTHAAITGETCPHVHCDMVFYETPNGGAVFSTSSIAWAGALSHNHYENNVSKITQNVIERFLDDEPL